MFRERIARVNNWWNEKNRRLDEFREFSKLFDPFGQPTGVLSPEGADLDPVEKGLFSLQTFELIRQLEKINKGKKLSEEDKRKVSERAWMTAVGGNFRVLSEGGILTIAVKTDNDDLHDYWEANEGQLAYIVFLDTGGEVARIRSESITYEATCDFPMQIRFGGIQSVRDLSELCIYSKSDDGNTVESIFARTKFTLITKTLERD